MSSPTAIKNDDGYDRWSAESDLRTLTDAEAIKKDAKRMKNVQRAAKEKLAEMAQIKGFADGKNP